MYSSETFAAGSFRDAEGASIVDVVECAAKTVRSVLVASAGLGTCALGGIAVAASVSSCSEVLSATDVDGSNRSLCSMEGRSPDPLESICRDVLSTSMFYCGESGCSIGCVEMLLMLSLE